MIAASDLKRYSAEAFPDIDKWCTLRSAAYMDELPKRSYFGTVGVALYQARLNSQGDEVLPTRQDHARARDMLERFRPLWMSFCVGPWYVERERCGSRGWLDEARHPHSSNRANSRRRLLNRLFGICDWNAFDGGFFLDKTTAFSFCRAFCDYGMLSLINYLFLRHGVTISLLKCPWQ